MAVTNFGKRQTKGMYFEERFLQHPRRVSTEKFGGPRRTLGHEKKKKAKKIMKHAA